MDGVNWERTLPAALGNTFLFRDTPPGLPERTLRDTRCVRACAQKAERIYTPHAFSRSLGVLLSGSIQVSKEALIVSVLAPGALFGAAALFNDAPDYATTLTARTDCDLLFLPQALVEDLMEECPAVARNYIAYLSGRIRFLSDKIEGLIAGTADRKLAQYLLEQMQAGVVLLDCSATGLAKRLNVSRASLYRAFDTLAEAGVAEKTGKTVRILDAKKLQTAFSD